MKSFRYIVLDPNYLKSHDKQNQHLGFSKFS